jgi:hypothetical protein
MKGRGMTFRHERKQRRKLAVAITAVLFSFAAHATEFDTGNGTRIIWNTTVSLGTAVRASHPDPELLQPVNAAQQGISGAVGGNTDDGDLNYRKGDTFSTPLKLVSDVSIQHGDFGGLVRVLAWRDFALSDRKVRHGSFNNGYQPNAELSDKGFQNLAKFSGVDLADAYVYGNFQPSIGDLRVTVGRQVLNWGESLFIPGLNQISPLNVSAFHQPGTEIRDVLLPVGMVSTNLSLSNGVSLEGFVQAQKATNVLDGCGNYFLPVDASVGPNAQNACAGGYIQALSLAQATQLAGALHQPVPTMPGDAAGQALGAYIPASATINPHSGSQFGLSTHFTVQALDTEFGLYAMNIDARMPVLSVVKGNSPLLLTTAVMNAYHVPGVSQSSVFWEYPHNTHVFGVSAATTLFNWSVGSELSYTPNQPVQLASGDLLAGLIYTASPVALSVLGVPGALAPVLNANGGPLADRFAAASDGDVIAGYDRLHKTQFQVNALQAFSNVLGARTLTVAGEVGMQWAGVPGRTDGVRYGRSFVFGIADSPTYNLGAYPSALTQGGLCPPLNTPGQTGCKNDGFATPFSWGYRLRGELSYVDAFGMGVTLKPTLSWSHDVKGYSVDGQFNQGRQTLGLSLGMEYAKRYKASLGYVTYNHSADWDPLRDRDYYYASVSAAF